MPCNTQQTVEQTLEGITDPNLLAEGLREMGFQATVYGSTVSYYGKGLTGSFENGKLSSTSPMDIPLLKKHTAVANLKKNAATHKWSIKKLGEFKYAVTK